MSLNASNRTKKNLWNIKKKKVCFNTLYHMLIMSCNYMHLVCTVQELISWTCDKHPAVSGLIQSDNADFLYHQPANQFYCQPCFLLVEFILGNQELISFIINDSIALINGICSLQIIMHHLQCCLTVMDRKNHRSVEATAC